MHQQSKHIYIYHYPKKILCNNQYIQNKEKTFDKMNYKDKARIIPEI